MKRIAMCLLAAAGVACLFALAPHATNAARKARVTKPADKPTSYYAKRMLRGWTLRVHKDLLDANCAALYAEVRDELDNHFYRIERVIPAGPLKHLKSVVIWIEMDNPKGRNCHYHPGVGWLKANHYNPDKVKGVEIGSARNFLRSVKHQPWMILHELAHAYHDQVLGFDHAEIKRTYEAARDSGTYDKVLIWNGRVGRHYAMTNQMEYFSENTEAYFGQNDIFPFVRAELKRHDPNMYTLLEKIWQVRKPGGK